MLDVDERQAHLMTLGENIARIPPQTIEYARALKEMKFRMIEEYSHGRGKA